MTHRPDFRRAIAFLPVSLAVLGVLSLFAPEKKTSPTKPKERADKGRSAK